MAGVWSKGGGGQWRPLTATGFVSEADLHRLIEATPTMLPLAGAPRLAIIGSEVRCGREKADLLAVEVETGRPVVIEIKLAANTDRRRALTQVLGYAAYLRRLDGSGLNSVLQTYLAKQELTSIVDAAKVAAEAEADLSFDEEAFQGQLERALADGRLRAVIVLDEAPPDLMDLVGYLQDVTSDRLALDLVVVTAYEVAGQRILVPQLVESDRTQVTAELAGTGMPASHSEVIPGTGEFAAAIETAPREQQDELRRLLQWARELEAEGLAVPFTSIGKGRWVLNLRLPRQARGMVSVWNERGPYVSPYRSVFEQEAPITLEKLDRLMPEGIGRGNYIKGRCSDEVLALIREAYVESRDSRA
ncbi:hypothetical protein GCM10009745_38980 [Kribbella yunnanensis]|uniref:DUF91 domain-containing protein n=1 Tax=Kribbella yunnanensis TaxID=190194 RepID=A0ABP4TL12_9ACTN